MITKSAYHYEIKCTLNNEPTELELNSFDTMSRVELMAEVIGDSEEVNLSGFQFKESEVVLGIQESDFLDLATVLKNKTEAAEKKAKKEEN